MYEYICSPVVEMREGPSSLTKVVSQALFGEKITVKEREGEWIFIQTPDAYTGWVKKESFISRETPYLKTMEVTRLSAHLYKQPDIEYGPLLTLPFGSPLEEIDRTDARWDHVRLVDGQEAFIQKGDVVAAPTDLEALSKKFLGLPYTWGGRSSFGYDCSGFVQMLFARENISLPRDAYQQFAWGEEIPLDKLKKGDLLFWGKSPQEIRHVALSLDPPYFIHTSSRENQPYLRISSYLDAEWSGQKGNFYPFRAARRIY